MGNLLSVVGCESKDQTLPDSSKHKKREKKQRTLAKGEYIVTGSFRSRRGIEQTTLPTQRIKPEYTYLGVLIEDCWGSIDNFLISMDEACIFCRKKYGGGYVELWFNPETEQMRITTSPVTSHDPDDFFWEFRDGYFGVVRTKFDAAYEGRYPRKYYCDKQLFGEYQIQWNDIAYYFAHRLKYYKEHKSITHNWDEIFDDEDFEVQYPRNADIIYIDDNEDICPA